MASAPENKNYDYLFKLLMVGDSGVGKTSILLQFTQNEFNVSTRSTVGVDLKVKMMKFRNKSVKLTIWDTAGQERFRTLTSSYYRGAHGIILVYDVTSSESFQNIKDWLKEIDIYSTNDDAVKMLVGNKIDKNTERKVSRDEAIAFAKSLNMMYIETSAKTKIGVQNAFEELIQKILDVPALLEGTEIKEEKTQGTVSVDQQQENAPDSLCGCF